MSLKILHLSRIFFVIILQTNGDMKVHVVKSVCSITLFYLITVESQEDWFQYLNEFQRTFRASITWQVTKPLRILID